MSAALSVAYSNPEGSMPAQGLYSNVGTPLSGTLHYVAGQLSVADDGTVAGVDDFDTQFDRIFQNLEGILKGMGGDLRSVVKFTTFVTDRSHIDLFMKKRAAFFPTIWPDEVYPPNTLLIVKGLVKPEFLLEVESIVSIKP